MRTLCIVGIILGAIGIFEGAIYTTLNNPMGYHPSRGIAIIVIGALFVIAGIAGLVIRSRRQRAAKPAGGTPTPLA